MNATDAAFASEPRLPGEAEIGLAHRFVEANGLRFHVVEAGHGPLMVLLHGFPEFWYSWKHQIRSLAGQFRVVAPDLRGYNLSDKPGGGYDLATLAGDVAALIQALGEQRAHVVGHDWGGAVAWGTAMWAPRRVERLVILNAPHPAAFMRELRRNPRQWLKSWYIGFFQIPWLPERQLGRRACLPIAQMMRGSTLTPEAFTQADLAVYRRAMCRPGALRAALASYRALGRTAPWTLSRQVRPIDAPTLVIWGDRDVALEPGLADELDRWVPNVRVHHVPDAGHWIQHEQPSLVNELLTGFLAHGGTMS